MQMRNLWMAAMALVTAVMLFAAPASSQTAAAPDRPSAEPQDNPAEPDPPSKLDRQMQAFRDSVDRSREELARLGQDIKSQLDSAMIELERGYRGASATAKAEWEDAKDEMARLNEEAARRLGDLAVSAETQWREAHQAAAETLEELAERIKTAANRSKAQSEHPKGIQETPNKS